MPKEEHATSAGMQVASTAYENSKRLERLEARVASIEERIFVIGTSISDLEDAIDES